MLPRRGGFRVQRALIRSQNFQLVRSGVRVPSLLKLQRFGENRRFFTPLCRGSTICDLCIEVQTKNSTDLEPVPGTELKSVEFFVCTSTCQQLSSLLSVKRLKRLMQLLGSGVYRVSVLFYTLHVFC